MTVVRTVRWSPSLAHRGCIVELLRDVKVVEAAGEDKLWHRLLVRHLDGGRACVCVCEVTQCVEPMRPIFFCVKFQKKKKMKSLLAMRTYLYAAYGRTKFSRSMPYGEARAPGGRKFSYY